METTFGILGFGLPLLLMVVGALEMLTRRRLYPRFGKRYDPRFEGATSSLVGFFSFTNTAVWAWDWPWWVTFLAWLPLAATSIATFVRGPLPDQTKDAS